VGLIAWLPNVVRYVEESLCGVFLKYMNYFLHLREHKLWVKATG
jgi:hypothetical protein